MKYLVCLLFHFSGSLESIIKVFFLKIRYLHYWMLIIWLNVFAILNLVFLLLGKVNGIKKKLRMRHIDKLDRGMMPIGRYQIMHYLVLALYCGM